MGPPFPFSFSAAVVNDWPARRRTIPKTLRTNAVLQGMDVRFLIWEYLR